MLSPVETEVVEVVRFPSGQWLLEGRIGYPSAGRTNGAVVIAGPHPLLGGHVGNNVVQALTAGLARMGSRTLSFNYRGVGGSEGPPVDRAHQLAEFWATSRLPEEAEYTADFVAAVKTARAFLGSELPLALVGYSFGALILPAAGAGPGVPMALIAPPVGSHDFAEFESLPNPVLVVAPDGDFAADPARLSRWAGRVTGLRQLVHGDWDGHFFRGHEDRLVALVNEFVREQWRTGA